MSRQSRKMRRLVASLAEVLDRAIYSDSYGVQGSDFQACAICGQSDAPGTFHDANWHKPSCPVARAYQTHQKAINTYWNEATR